MLNRKARSWEGKHAQLAETDETTQPKRPVQQLVERDHSTEALAQPIQAHQLSYHSTGWAYTDLALEMIDKFTGGHADWIQRAFSYLLFGGFAAIVQLIFFYIMYYRVPLPVDQPWHYVIAFAVANEVANLANFFSNDLITFSSTISSRIVGLCLTGKANAKPSKAALIGLTAFVDSPDRIVSCVGRTAPQ